MSNISIDHQFKRIDISKELKVTITFDEIFTLPAIQEGGESRVKVRAHKVKCDDIPHNDLLDLMKKLKPHVFDIVEMDYPDTKKIKDFQISSMIIKGDVLLQKSRVEFIISKKIGRTNKVMKMGPTSQVAMYGESVYPEAEKMSKIIESILDEIKAYLMGKFAPESPINGEQLPIFPKHQLELEEA